MGKPSSTMEQQIAPAASAFEQQRTGHVPKSVNVLLSEDILLITLHGALSPAEQTLARAEICCLNKRPKCLIDV